MGFNGINLSPDKQRLLVADLKVRVGVGHAGCMCVVDGKRAMRRCSAMKSDACMYVRRGWEKGNAAMRGDEI